MCIRDRAAESRDEEESRRVPAALFLVAALGCPSAAQSATPYGCGTNPPGSLQVFSGQPAIGQTLTLAVDNPLGTQTADSPALLFLSTAPDPSFPCGTLLPGFGMAGEFGELLIATTSPNPFQQLGPVTWPGSGLPALFQLAIPSKPGLVGKSLYVQGAIVDLFSPVGVGLTEGLELVIGPDPASQKPDLVIAALSVGPRPVAPGEPLTLTAVVRNQGDAGVQSAVVEGCGGPNWCATALVGPLPPGGQQVVELNFATNASHKDQNPHWFTAVVDPGSAVDEGDETNNERTVTKPAFVVELLLVTPMPEEEHDEFFSMAGGVPSDYTFQGYGLDGAPSEVVAVPDPDKVPYVPSGTVLPQPRIAPSVLAAEEAAAPGEKLTYFVKFEHKVPMPRLPDLVDPTDRFSAANVPLLEQRLGMMEAVRRARFQAGGGLVQMLQQNGGQVLEFYTLSGAMLVEAPKGLLSQFDAHPLVQHVEDLGGGEPPPDSIADGRALLDSDVYFNLGATGVTFMGLVDSGVRTSHTLLTSGRLWFVEDCVNGNGDCDDTGDPDYDPDDDCWDHGTATASILTGNDNLGLSSRGVTESVIDSWKVYPCLLYTSPSPRDQRGSRMPSSA